MQGTRRGKRAQQNQAAVPLGLGVNPDGRTRPIQPPAPAFGLGLGALLLAAVLWAAPARAASPYPLLPAGAPAPLQQAPVPVAQGVESGDETEMAAPDEPAQGPAAEAAASGSGMALAPDAAGAAAASESSRLEDYGIEYALSKRAADSFLGRMTSRLVGLVQHALSLLGSPYRRGGTTARGFDCSGFTTVLFARQGISLPRTAAEQFQYGVPVAADELAPGDLVFFRDTYKRGISHVGIYIGEGRFVHAASRRQGVIESEMARSYYASRYAGARRLPLDREEGETALAGGLATAGARMAGFR